MAQADVNNEELLTIGDHIKHLRKWIHQQQPILNSLDTDEFLLRFLRVTDFRLENAKEWLVQFWRYRTENPQWLVILLIKFYISKFIFLIGFKIVIYSKTHLCVKLLT
jgi:hypothetical protein